MNEKIHTILIVDDSPENIDILIGSFKDEYKVLVATSGPKALEIVTKNSPDLILLDIMMPGMDGYEVCRKLKDAPQTKDIPVFFLTASTGIDDKTQGFEEGAVDYITKPFHSAEVKARIKTHLTLKDMQEDLHNKNLILKKQVIEIQEKTENLKRSQKRLIQSEKMASLGQLVAGVAHEINTPVGIGVTVSSHLAKSTQKIISSFENNKMTKGDLTKYFSSTLETSELMLQHLLQTADLIKSFKMVSADQTAHERRKFNVKSYLEDIILSLRPKLKNKPHQITIDCDDDIEIDGYPGALAQIITNMVLNSLIHAFNEGDNGTIAIEVLKNASGIILKYRDDGKGIPEENIENIFEPFFTTKRGEGGTGLGMHIVYNTVTQILKGSISCESIQGKGISFFINLPAKLEN